MKAYFNRTEPFLFTTIPSFYATEIEIDAGAMNSIDAFSALLKDMKKRIRDAASPERADKELAAYFEADVIALFKTVNPNGNE